MDSARDRQRTEELAAAIEEIDEAMPPVMDAFLPDIRDLLDAPAVGSYSFRQTSQGLRTDFVKAVGFGRGDTEVRASIDSFLGAMSERRGFWDPANPQPAEQNRVVVVPCGSWCAGDGPDDVEQSLRAARRNQGPRRESLATVASTMWELENALRTLGMRAHDQLRVLLCDGGLALAWVGAFQPEPFRARQRRALEQIAAPLRSRLILERYIAGGGLGHAAMEHISSPAYVLDAAGRIAHANAAGREALGQEGSKTRSALAALVRGERSDPAAAVTKLAGAGLPPQFLVVESSRVARVHTAIERARASWGLTAREADVLAELADGRSTRDMADRLGTSSRTLEIHVSAILRKASVQSRSQIVAALWRLSDRTEIER